MVRVLLVLSIGLFASSSSAQHTIEGFPNPYDGETDEYLVLRNTGSEPVLLDSLAFAGILNAIPDTPYTVEFSYEAFLGGEEISGFATCYYIVVEPNEYTCRQGFGGDPLLSSLISI